LISHSLNKPKSWVLTHGEYQLTPSDNNALNTAFERYLKGVPLPYLLEEWAFFGRRYKVTPDVLIPRPETEILVESAIAFGKHKKNLSIIDVGTGSGIIAISLAAAFPGANLIAVDLSIAALKIAKENAQIHHRNQIIFIQTNLITPIKGHFDLICANLPYIPSGTLEKLPVGKWEPQMALDGGTSGLVLIEQLLIQAENKLARGGCILLEIESSLGKESMELAKNIIPNSKRQLLQDLSGKDRVIQITLP